MDWSKVGESLSGDQLTAEDAFAALILVVIGIIVSLVIGRWRHKLLARTHGQNKLIVAMSARVAQVLVLTVFVGWALSKLGADIGWLTATMVMAVLIGVLAARPILEGMGASAALSTRPAFTVGDEIGVGEVVGEVLAITTRSTVLALRDGRSVHIPNVEMLNKTVTVYTVDGLRRTAVDLTFSTDTDIDRVETILRRALDELDEITRVGSIRARSIHDGVQLSVRFWHPSNIESGNDALDAAVRTIRSTLSDEGVCFAPPAEVLLSGSVGGSS